MKRTANLLCSTALAFAITTVCRTQGPSPTSPPGDQEALRVFTEEILIPVRVTDDKGRFEPFVDRDDLMVLEDGRPQQITALRRVPPSVLLLICTSGELNPAMRIGHIRQVGINVISQLKTGALIAVLQYGNDVESIQDWTTDKNAAVTVIRRKLWSTRGSRLARALHAAAERFKGTPPGNRHVVLVTDGVDEAEDGKEGLTDAVRDLLVASVTVHVIGYAQIASKAMGDRGPLVTVSAQKTRKTAIDIAEEIMNPAGTPYKIRPPRINVTIDLDIQMRRSNGEYQRRMREGVKWLTALAAETGGSISLPSAADFREAAEISRSIDSRYVLTYRPTRPLASAVKEEYRTLDVIPRRIGLNITTRRGYIVIGSQ